MQPELENLKVTLTDARPGAKTTVDSYLSKARPFLEWLPHDPPPTELDLHKYFDCRRQQGIGERTLATSYAVLKKLYAANSWPWPLTRENRPRPSRRPTMLAFRPTEIEELIHARDRYSKAETFYLALSITYGLWREELARVTSRDIRGGTILIHSAQRGLEQRHFIPEQILPAINAYRPKKHHPRALSDIFQRICLKGLGQTMPRYGWHSILKTLMLLVQTELVKKGLDIALAADFFRPLKTPDQDEYEVDRIILEVHPFLSYWQD